MATMNALKEKKGGKKKIVWTVLLQSFMQYNKM